jgi:bifunctional non-homologous end joining protein LigD
MLAGGVGFPPSPEGWIVEPKWDGVRAIVTVVGGAATMRSRNDKDITGAYPELHQAPASLDGHQVVLDAEIVAFDASGRTKFGALQRRMHVRNPPPALVAEVPVSAIVFDVLWLDGRLLIDDIQTERRAVLDELGINADPWITSPVLDLRVERSLLDTGRELGLEGFMLKRPESAYLPGRRSPSWVKIKCVHSREFVVGGWQEGRAGRTGSLGSLAVGVYTAPAGTPGRKLRFMGMVGSGLSSADLKAFAGMVDSLSRPDSPFSNAAPRGVRFLQPVLVAQVTFSEVTAAGTLRHPRLDGFRADLDAEHVVMDAELEPGGAG